MGGVGSCRLYGNVSIEIEKASGDRGFFITSPQKVGHVYGSKATKKKVLVGKCTNYFSNLGVAEFSCEAAEVKVGDELLVTGPTTGVIQFEAEEIREDLKPVEITTKGIAFSVKTPELVRRGDKIFKWEMQDK